MKLQNKKAEMTIGTIIAIILAIVVLVFLVLGFSQGFGNLWDNIINFGGGESNVDTIVTSCQASCAIGNEYDYCKERTVKFGKEQKGKVISGIKLDSKGKGIGTCENLEGANVGLSECSAVDKCVGVTVDKECKAKEDVCNDYEEEFPGCSDSECEAISGVCNVKDDTCGGLDETACDAKTKFCGWVDKTVPSA